MQGTIYRACRVTTTRRNAARTTSTGGSADNTRESLFNKIFQHRVTRNTGALAIVQLVNYIAPALVLIRLTRVLGLETYGVVAFSIGISQLAIVVLDLGFTLSATQKISVWRGRKEYVARLIGAIYGLKLIAFLLVAGALIGYAVGTEKYTDYSLLFIFSLLSVFGQCFQPVWFFIGLEQMRYITYFLVGAKVIFVLLVYLLVAHAGDYLWVPVADGLAQLAATATAISLVYRLGYRVAFPRWREMKYAFKMTFGFLISRLAGTAYMSSGVLILGLFSTPAAVAAYSLAEQCYRAMTSAFNPIVQALYPHMAKEKNLLLLGKVTMGCAMLAVFGAVLGYILAPHLIPLVFGKSWDGVIPVLNVFFMAITVDVLNALSGYPLGAALGNLKVANRTAVYGAIVYLLVAGVLLILRWDTPVAFAWLTIVSLAYVLAHRAFVLGPAIYHARAQHGN